MSASSSRMRGPGSNPVGGVARAAWRALRRPYLRHGPSAHGQKPQPNPSRASAAGAAEVAAAAAGRPASSRSHHPDRPAPHPASDRRGSGDHGEPSADAIGDGTPHPDPPPQGGRVIQGRRDRETSGPALPARPREISSPGLREIFRAAAGAEGEAAVVGRDPEDPRVKAERRAPAVGRRQADAVDRAEFAGIEWTSEALA